MRSIWSSPVINTNTKIWLFSATVLSVVTYASETWKMTSKIAKKLDVFQQRCLRTTLHVSYRDHSTKEEILQRTGSRRLRDIVAERRFRMAGHILCLSEERPAKTAMTWTPSEGRRGRGRPKETWRTFCKDLARVNIIWEECATVAADRSRWRQLAAAQCAKPHGRN